MRTFYLWSAAVLIAACSAGTAGDDDDDDDDGTGAAAGSGAAAGFGGTAGTGGTGVGAGGTGGTGASGGDPKLLPLEVGYQWTYQVQAVGVGSVCSPGSYSFAVVGSEMVGGRNAFELSSWCTGVGGTDYYSPGTGDEVLFYYDGQWLTLIDPNLQEGHSWPYFNTSYTWHRESSITVPAGTYDDCWTAQQDVSYTAFLTYCRGVGLVRSYSEDLVGSGWDAQLSAKNF